MPSSSHEQQHYKRMDVGQSNNRGKFPPLQLISLSIGSVVLLFYFNQLFTTASRRDVAVVAGFNFKRRRQSLLKAAGFEVLNEQVQTEF